MRKLLLILVIASITAGRTNAADQHCTAEDTLRECFNKFVSPPAVKAAAEQGTQQAVSAANTGISSLVSPSQSTAKDFLSMLSAAMLVPMQGNGAKPLSIDYNVPIPVIGGDEERIKFQAVLAKPELSSEMKERLANNTAAMADLKDSLSEIDDLTVSISLDPSTRHLGRSIKPHREFFQRALDSVLSGQPEADDAFNRFVIENNITDLGAKIKDARRTNPDLSVAVVEEAARAAAESPATDFAKSFTVLLNNQPQLYGSALYHARKKVAGANERSARVTYEMGFRNLNAFYAANRSCVDKNADKTCAGQLISFAGATATADDRSDRVALSFEYRASSDLAVVLPQYAINFTAPKAHTLVYSLAYGRNSMIMKEGRFDVAVNYEDTTVSKAVDVVTTARSSRAAALVTATPKAVHDRFVASATFTYKINNMMAMPLSLIYANHASFLGNVDRKLNAHFGITFKMPSP